MISIARGESLFMPKTVAKPWIAFICLAIIGTIGFVDYLTGLKISFSLFYVIPILISAWYLGRAAGIAAAAASEAVWFSADAAMNGIDPISFWNAGMRLGVFITIALILSSLKAMLDRLKHEHERSQALAGQILFAQEQERQRVSRELHDEAGQALAGLTLRIEEMKLHSDDTQNAVVPINDLDDLKELACRISGEIRRLAFNLRPAMLEDLGLGHCISSLMRDQLRKRGIKVSLSIDNPEERPAPEVELALYRIAQEAVANIVKYANATEVTANLARRNGTIHFEIADNGAGFEPSEASRKRRLGISGMEERVAILGGQFKLTASNGAGTKIFASIPAEL